MAVSLNILALDVGERRVGTASANSVARLSSPGKTLIQSEELIDEIKAIVQSESVNLIVVGLPQNMSNQDTDQTRYVRAFTDQLKKVVDVPIHFENEALSSVRAKQTLDASGKAYKKEEIDSLAACYILDDFMVNNPEVVNG